MRIAIIGAGCHWNGCHLAIELAKAGHDITVFEKLPAIFSGCSGTFVIRLHRGPHYPRSKSTREGCHAAFERFCETYPEIIKHHQDSIYAHGERDAEGCPPKISANTFKDVCFETTECQKVDVEAKAIEGVTAAYDLNEPSVAIGTELRSFFEHKLAAEGVKVLLDVEVQEIRRRPCEPFTVFYRKNSPGNRCIRQTGFLDADYVVNATAYVGFEKLPQCSISETARSALDASFPADRPEMEYLVENGFDGYNRVYANADPMDGFRYGTISPAGSACFSVGNVSIRSADMRDAPVINPNYLTHPIDIEMAIAAFKRVRKIWESMPGLIIGEEYFPARRNVSTDEDILQHIRESSIQLWHAAASCKMGGPKDPMAVLDTQARVRGVSGLRVIDASSFLFLPPGHPVATVYMLALKIADDVLKGDKLEGTYRTIWEATPRIEIKYRPHVLGRSSKSP